MQWSDVTWTALTRLVIVDCVMSSRECGLRDVRRRAPLTPCICWSEHEYPVMSIPSASFVVYPDCPLTLPSLSPPPLSPSPPQVRGGRVALYLVLLRGCRWRRRVRIRPEPPRTSHKRRPRTRPSRLLHSGRAACWGRHRRVGRRAGVATVAAGRRPQSEGVGGRVWEAAHLQEEVRWSRGGHRRGGWEQRSAGGCVGISRDGGKCTAVSKVVSRSKFTEQIFTPQTEENYQMCGQIILLL